MFPNASREEVDLTLARPHHTRSTSTPLGRALYFHRDEETCATGRLDWLAPAATVAREGGFLWSWGFSVRTIVLILLCSTLLDSGVGEVRQPALDALPGRVDAGNVRVAPAPIRHGRGRSERFLLSAS